MTTTFIEMYINETSETRIIVLRGDLSSRSASRLSRWMDNHEGSAIVAMYQVDFPVPQAREWLAEVLG